MAQEEHDVEVTQETTAVDTEHLMSAPVLPEAMPADSSIAADLDSQPLNDLGVSVMDQDVLERNVAAQVQTHRDLD